MHLQKFYSQNSSINAVWKLIHSKKKKKIVRPVQLLKRKAFTLSLRDHEIIFWWCFRLYCGQTSKSAKLSLLWKVGGRGMISLSRQSHTSQSWVSVAQSCRRVLISAFFQVYYAALWWIMSSCLKRCYWLASRVEVEVHVNLHPPQLVPALW